MISSRTIGELIFIGQVNGDRSESRVIRFKELLLARGDDNEKELTSRKEDGAAGEEQ